MTFDDFLRDLCLIELSDLVFVEPDTMNQLRYPSAALRSRILPTINSALRQLYIEHRIEQRDVVLRTNVGTSLYYLRPEHAVTHPDPLIEKYLIDSPERPFTGNLVRIDQVLDEDERLVFAEHLNPLGGLVRRPSWDCLAFSNPQDDKEYLVRYRVSAPTMTEGQDDDAVQMALPPGYADLLRLQVAARLYGQQKTQESVVKAGQLYSEAASLATLLQAQDTLQEGGWNLDDLMAMRGFR